MILKKLLLRWSQRIFPCRQLPVPQSPDSILIVRQHDQLGDFLMSTPVFREIKRALPNCRITVVATEYTRPLLENNPHVERVLVYQRKALRWRPADLLRFIKGIRLRYDLAMVLSTPSRSFTSDLIGFFSGAAFRLGMQSHENRDEFRYDFLYHATAVRPHPRINQASEGLTILEPLGIRNADSGEELFVGDEEKEWAKTMLVECGASSRAVFLLPGVHIKERRWPAASFVELGRRLSLQRRIVVLWGPGQEEAGETVLKGLTECGAQTIRGTSVRQLAALLSLAGLVVCNDTGDLHVSSSVGANTLGLYGPTNPGIYAPPGKHVFVAQSPTGRMADLTVEAVWEKAMTLCRDTG